VEDFNFGEIKTKQMADVLTALNLTGQKILQLLPAQNSNIYLSSRNIERLTTQIADKVSTYDILSNKKILVHKSAIDVIAKTFAE
jgi:large subunit ribosomal protein L4